MRTLAFSIVLDNYTDIGYNYYTYYELDGNNIISETTNGNTIRYYYGNGGIVGFRYNGNRYYYEKNLQGDIIGIYDEDGRKLCEYVYDAWGNCTIENDVSDARIGEVNSFRYRGYYYDSDIGLYYLKSRYYDPQVARFVNADEVSYLGANGDLCAYNLFAYCSCNPVMYIDSMGCGIKKKKKEKPRNGKKITVEDSPCIMGQGSDESVSGLKYGKRTIASVGCELVAVYNALALVGNPQKFDDILSYAEKNKKLIWLGGIFGTKPRNLGLLLKKYDEDYALMPKNSYNEALGEGVYIISFWVGDTVFDGIHTVAFTCDADKNIIVYNRYNNSETPYLYESKGDKTGVDRLLEETGGVYAFYEIS